MEVPIHTLAHMHVLKNNTAVKFDLVGLVGMFPVSRVKVDVLPVRRSEVRGETPSTSCKTQKQLHQRV